MLLGRPILRKVTVKLVSGLRYIDIHHIGKSKEAGTLVEESLKFFTPSRSAK